MKRPVMTIDGEAVIESWPTTNFGGLKYRTCKGTYLRHFGVLVAFCAKTGDTPVLWGGDHLELENLEARIGQGQGHGVGWYAVSDFLGMSKAEIKTRIERGSLIFIPSGEEK